MPLLFCIFTGVGVKMKNIAQKVQNYLIFDGYTENMLKKKRQLFLGLMVIAGSACVTPTHASSAPQVLITHVQAGSSLAAAGRSEYVAIYNNSPVAVRVDSWCVTNKSKEAFACIEPIDGAEQYLPAYSGTIFASTEYMKECKLQAGDAGSVYDPGIQTSGRIVGSSDTLTLVNQEKVPVDTYAWTKTLDSGKVARRIALIGLPLVYANTGSASDWSITGPPPPVPVNGIALYDAPVGEPGEEPENPDNPTNPTNPTNPESPDNPDKPENPQNPESPQNPTTENPGGQPAGPPANPPVGSGVPSSAVLKAPYITEVLPNPKGTDTGNEFVELYNPNDLPVALDSYRLHIGTKLDAVAAFPAGVVLAPQTYLAFTNGDVKFTLNNTAGAVQLFEGSQAVGDVVRYSAPKEAQSWAYFEEIGWQYTNSVTPSSPNLPMVIDELALATAAAPTTPKACAANQYRNLETGRCKLLSTVGTAAPTPCKANQERNPATNRCRNSAAPTVPTPCKEGQERNPETNRCRNVKEMSTAGHRLDTAATDSANKGVAWYYWAGIGGIILSIIAYGVWEWRDELRQFVAKARQTFTRSSE